MKFHYQGIDAKGHTINENLEAATLGEAQETLRKRGMFVVEINEATKSQMVHKGRAGGRGKKLKNFALFCRQLYVLVNTGTPLVQSLQALERQIQDSAWRDVLGKLREEVEEGASLSQAMCGYPEYFDQVSRSLIAAGESGGNFDVMLDRLASLLKKQVTVRSNIVGALVYPILLVVVSVAVLIVMLTFVLPRFADLFKTLDTALPPTTAFLMFLSHALTQYWWMTLIAFGVVGTAIKFWLASAQGKVAFDTVVLILPKLGKITKNFCTARVIRLLGTLIESKVPLIDALQLTCAATTNTHYSKLLKDAEDAVTRGESIAQAFDKPKLIDPSVCEAIRNGERSGRVGLLLLNMSEFLDEENEVIVKSLTSIIEPVILIVLGVLVGFVAISMFLPLFDLTAATRG
ncbi:MAG TPA: type II secretion system F family protein [Tepidisphaeraceae bacterium]|jgi:type II secretory pathway component PulF